MPMTDIPTRQTGHSVTETWSPRVQRRWLRRPHWRQTRSNTISLTTV
jgi:hypothetical protein